MRRARFGRSVLAATAAAFISDAARAQTPPLIVGGERIDRAPASDELRGLTDAPRRPSAPIPIVPTPTYAEPAALQAVTIEGSSLPPDALDNTWRAMIGRPLDHTAIAAISGELDRLYAASDIALYTIVAPHQNLRDGELLLTILEGRIGDVVIATNAPAAPDIALLRRYGARLMSEAPLRRETLERYVSLIRDTPGVTVQAAIESSEQPSAARLALTAKRNRFDIGLSASNRGTPQLGDTQMSADIGLNGALRGGDRAELAVTTPAGGDAFLYLAARYATPIGDDGANLSFNLSRFETRPDGGGEGQSIGAGAAFSYPLLRGYTRNLNVSVSLDALDSENAVLGQTVDSSITRVLRAGLSYSRSEENYALSGALYGALGLDAWGARVDPFFAQADFIKLTAYGAYSYALSDRIALRLRTQAQWSADMAPSSEQMALGGDAYGRAYVSGIVQGDSGAAAALEFALAPSGLPEFIAGSELYAFIDVGTVHLNARPLFEDVSFDLSSTGAGARFLLGGRVHLGLELARGLAAPFANAEQDWRLVYTLQARKL